MDTESTRQPPATPPPLLRRRAVGHRCATALAVVLATLWVVACGDGATTPAPTPNRAPATNGTVADQTVSVAGATLTVRGVAQGAATVTVTAADPSGLSVRGSFTVTVPNRAPLAVDVPPPLSVFLGASASVEMSAYFTDPDGDPLVYTATTSNIVAVWASVTDAVVTVEGVNQGASTVTVTATDPAGLSAEQSFLVTVPNRAPEAVGTAPPQTLFVAQTVRLEMSSYFSDPDGDVLAFAVTSSNPAVVSASSRYDIVTLEALASGTATITVTARDTGGLSAEQSFLVTVPNREPATVGTIPSLTVHVGASAQVDMAPYFTDPDGDALAFSAASSDPLVSVSSTSGGVTVSALAAGTATVTVTATDPAGLSAQQSFQVTVPNREPATAGAIPPLTVGAGDSVGVDMSPYFTDPDGDALSYSAASSDVSVAFALARGATVTVRGIAPGMATVTVSATDLGGLAGQQSFSVTVPSRPNRAPEAVGAMPGQTIQAGNSVWLDLPPYFTDPDGDTLVFSATSSDSTVSVTDVGRDGITVNGVAPGNATVTITATDPSGLAARQSFPVTVTPPPSVTILDVDPEVLVEGSAATITGFGFSAVRSENRVSVGGLTAQVTAASPAKLSITVPWSDCLPPRRDELRVEVDSLSVTRTVGVSPPAESMDLPPGSYTTTYAGNGCVYLPGSPSGAEYLVGVVSNAEAAASLTPVTLRATPGDATVTVTATSATVADRFGGNVTDRRPGSERIAFVPAVADALTESSVLNSTGTRSANLQPGTIQVAATAAGLPLFAGAARDSLRIRRTDAHDRIMSRNRALLQRLGRAPRRLPPEAAADGARSVEAGDTLTLYGDFNRGCSESHQVQAVVRVVGEHTTWLDDIHNPAGTFTDSELTELDAFYSSHTKPVLDDYYGGLSDVDGSDRIMVLMTKEANQAEVGGWVWFGDLYSRMDCQTSNEMEIFFAMVPDPEGVFGPVYTKESVLDYYPSLLTHEITHLVQANAWVFGDAAGMRWS